MLAGTGALFLSPGDSREKRIKDPSGDLTGHRTDDRGGHRLLPIFQVDHPFSLSIVYTLSHIYASVISSSFPVSD